MLFRNKQKEIETNDARSKEMRDMTFETILKGHKCMKDLRVISNHEYWKWRLPFDLKRYKLEHHEL